MTEISLIVTLNNQFTLPYLETQSIVFKIETIFYEIQILI